MNLRSFWWLAFAFTLMWIWFKWLGFEQNYEQVVVASAQEEQIAQPEDIPQARVLPQEDQPAGQEVQSLDETLPQARAAAETAERILVKTDTLLLELDTFGGDIRDVKILQHGMPKDPDTPFHLMSDSGQLNYTAQSGLAMVPGGSLTAPNHRSIFSASQTNYELQGDELRVPLVWQENGVKVTKTYVFQKGSYLIDVEFHIENSSAETWTAGLYSQFVRTAHDPYSQTLMHTYTGPVYYDDKTEDTKYNKISFSDLDKSELAGHQIEGGWAAMIQHYFVTAIVPNQEVTNDYYAKPLSQDRYSIGVLEPSVKVDAGETKVISSKIYIGPTEQNRMKKIAPGLEKTIDYGIFTILAEPLFWLLNWIHKFIGNWGWSIIILTILIKAAFYKLSETSYRSMARLRKFQPKLKQLKENYGDDKALFQQKMMKLYREEKINPLGGCLPILVQMPVFIALYWVLIYSVEMRQAEWILWITDLSQKDPFFILPVLMGLTMFVQQKLNPMAMMDEMQQKVMKMLPFIFTIFFMWFPAGLVLYWLMNNIISVAQQWYITRKIEAGEDKTPAKPKKN